MIWKFFFSGSKFYVSFDQNQIKFLVSSPWQMQNLDPSLNITFIQLSTHHNCFSLTWFNLIYFCLCVNSCFYLAFLNVNSISFSWFPTVLSQSLASFSIYLFSCTFSISKYIALSFLSWCWLGTTIIFLYTSLWIAFMNEFYDPYCYFNWQFFCWNHGSF